MDISTLSILNGIESILQRYKIGRAQEHQAALPIYTSSVSEFELAAGDQNWTDREIGFDNGLRHSQSSQGHKILKIGHWTLDNWTHWLESTRPNCQRIEIESAPHNFRFGFKHIGENQN